MRKTEFLNMKLPLLLLFNCYERKLAKELQAIIESILHFLSDPFKEINSKTLINLLIVSLR